LTWKGKLMEQERAVSTDAVERIHRVLSESGEEVGPWMQDEDGEPDPTRPIPNAMLTEWVVLMSWVDPASGRSYTTRCTSPNLPRHHEDGLLHQALFQFE
jgi:hypothetical protein